MSHSQFEKIPISSERRERMINEQIEEINYAIDEAKRQNGERWTVKQMESQKKKLEEQLRSLADESRKDDLITFEELGIDSLMVDEAHSYKNLDIFSKMNNVSVSCMSCSLICKIMLWRGWVFIILIPKLRNGKYFIVESEPDWYVKQVMEEFVVRAERIL